MKINKIVKKIIIILFFTIIIIGMTTFLLIHSYINKMNLTSESSENIRIPQEVDIVENIPNIANSSEREIDEMAEEIKKNPDESHKDIKTDEQDYNILIIGCDSRKANGSGRSDVMLILSINEKSEKIILTSLLRDIYVKVPGHDSNRLNAAYAYGGATLLIDTVESNFGIDIDAYTSMDFFTFIDIIDAIGGVVLDITKEDIPIINSYIMEINRLNGIDNEEGILVYPGTYNLNGKQVLSYVRNRYIGTDFKRTYRQRVVVQQVFNQLKDSNIFTLKELLDTVLPQITTNLSEAKMISLLLAIPKYKDYEMEQWSIPMEGTYSLVNTRGMAVIQIDFPKNIDELHTRVYEN